MLLLAALCLASGCDDSTTSPGPVALRIEPDSVDLAIGDTLTLRAVLVGGGQFPRSASPVLWESLDLAVATIDSTGLVTARSEGVGRILATTPEPEEASGDLSAVATVVVIDPIVGLTIQPDSAVLARNDTLSLAALFVRSSGARSEATEIAWQSLDPSLAAVDDAGRVVGLAPGMARIRAEARDLLAEAVIVVSRWSLATPLPEARRTGHVAAHSGQLYYIGGDASLSEDYVATTFVFDPATRTWNTGAAMPTPRGQGAVAVLDDRIHLIGGVNPQAAGNVESRLVVHEAYRPADDSWETLAPMEFPRGGVRADSLSGRIYAVGGSRGPLSLDSVEVYDPATDTWARAPSLPQPRLTMAVGSLGGRLLVAGGSADRIAFSDLFVFDPAAGTWTAGPPMASTRHRGAAAVVDDALVVVGGLETVDAGGFLTSVESFDGSWASLASLPAPAVDAGSAVLDGALYVVGGVTPDGITGKMFVLEF